MKKKYLIPFFVLMFAFLFPVTACAGSINDAEQGIINAISATYEYNGAYYKVTDAYIAQVTAYLSQEGIDLTSEQANDYVSQFHANIATGISSGYMVQVGTVGNSTPGETQGTSETTEETETAAESLQSEEKASDSDHKDETLSKSDSNNDIEETESGKIEIVDNTIGSTQSGKIDYTVAPMNAVMYVWDIDVLDVHTEAYKDSDIIGTLYPGDKVIVTGAATTGWAQIDYNGETGYVSATYLRTEGYMKNEGIEIETETEIEIETEEREELTTEESTATEYEKDYSNAEPFSKSVKIEVIAVGVVVLLIIISAVIVLLHKNKSKK